MASQGKHNNRIHLVRTVFSHSLTVAAVSATTAGLAEIMMHFFVSGGKKETLSQFGKTISNFAPGILIGFLIISGLIITFVLIFELHQTGSALKNEVANAFTKALDSSSFNPRRLEKDSHEYKLNAEALRRTP